MKTYSITTPDGAVHTRKSERPYTHAIYGVSTQETLTKRSAPCLAQIAKLENDLRIVFAARKLQTPAEQESDRVIAAAYNAINDKSDETRAGVYDPTYYDRWSAAHDAYCATLLGKVANWSEQLACDRRNLAGLEKRLAVGAVIEVSWSQSAKNAEGAASKIRKWCPGAVVTITTEITERAHVPRAKKVS